MASVNKVILLGNLGRDPEVRFTQGGTPVANFTMATTDRWSDEQVDVWFKTTYKNGTEAGLAWSHEEQMVDMMRQFISSYKDLPDRKSVV